MDQLNQSSELLKLTGGRDGLGGGNGAASGGFMGFTLGGMIAATVVSGVGFFYFKRGKRDADYFTVATGVVLMAYPYFVTNTLYIVLIGAAIIGYHYYHTNYE